MSTLQNKRIAVLKGGPGSEREVSHASAAGVVGALKSLGAKVVDIDVTGLDFELPQGIDFVFNIIHGTLGEDGQLQRELERRGVRYTGAGVEGSELAFNKIKAKKRFVERGVPTANYEIVKAGAAPALPLPYVIKAPCEGSSVGVYIVKTPEEIAPAVEGAAKYADQLLVEEFIEGRELTVGILGEEALPIIEIRPKIGFYDFANKYPFLSGKGGADHVCPAALDEAAARLVQQTALEAHRALDLEVYSRVDLILRPDGKALVIEINTIPGMTEASLLPEAARAAGIGYPELCERIARLSLSRP